VTWRPRARQIALAGPSGLHGADPFKLILVDLELPDGNGMELLAELTQYPATKIVTTLYSDDDHLFPALQCGADGYLLKEDRFEVLVEELQKIVRGQPPAVAGHRAPAADPLPPWRRPSASASAGRASATRPACTSPPGADRKPLDHATPDAARERGADLPEQGLHDQGDREA
jgi:two-component system nitrate/nitrite response regulator NarL